MILSPTGLGTKKDCAGEPAEIYTTDEVLIFKIIYKVTFEFNYTKNNSCLAEYRNVMVDTPFLGGHVIISTFLRLRVDSGVEPSTSYYNRHSESSWNSI
jgi:hypothetical protein